MSRWEETSYPVPARALIVSCLSCGTAVAGGRRGSRNIRNILKQIKAHDDARHPPYDPSVIHAVTGAVEELNAGAPAPRRLGRLIIDLAGSIAAMEWRQQAEILERHIGVLVEQRRVLEVALDRLRHERDVALAAREDLRHQLTEALKEIDVLRGLRDTLGAQLIKAQPSRRDTGLLAEMAKAAASAVVGAAITIGAQWAAGLDNVERDAMTVVNHANVVIVGCQQTDPAGAP